jgi:uncharacterized protein YndB with AHSA1/START domain
MVDSAAGSSATAGRSQRAGGPGWSHRSGGHRVVSPGESGSRWAARTLAGTNPRPASSGQVTRHRLNRSGDHQLNAALHTIALTWLRYDPETRAYRRPPHHPRQDSPRRQVVPQAEHRPPAGQAPRALRPTRHGDHQSRLTTHSSLSALFSIRQGAPRAGGTPGRVRDVRISRAAASTKRRVIMMQPRELALRMKRIVRVPPSAVFRVCTEPKELARWWGPRGSPRRPSSSTSASVAAIGSRCSPRRGTCSTSLVSSARSTLLPALSTRSCGRPPDPDARETVVTLSFRHVDGSTQVSFRQGVFATEERRALHEQGWTESFERLQELVSAP